MPQAIKKSVPVKKAAVPVKKAAPSAKGEMGKPSLKSKFEAAMQKEWKSRPENKMKSSPKEATPMKERVSPGQRFQPSSNANEIKIAQRASYMTQEAPYKKMKTEVTPKKNK